MLQHAQAVFLMPDFHDLAVLNANDVDARNRHLLAGCGDAKELPLVSGTIGPPIYNLVPFGNQILKCGLEIREGVLD